ncbi:methyltransferase domain-containing protein [Streptomyces sp. NPDC093085]|uniref:methyltransferase domain-containing protein n=1 Tax=Streptomyces sp. NPDC093085 TaxID=3155068 RepID=UPI003422401A
MTGLSAERQRVLAARVGLVRSMERGGLVLSARMAEAFLNVPREPFVPVFYRREGDRFSPWAGTRPYTEAWLAQVYADDSLITEVDGVHAEDAGPGPVTGVPTSSSTAPGLMADMLDALDVRQGTRVLEIGTGSGYNAALLCRLAGQAHVTTVDRSKRLTDTARDRLEALGMAPTVGCADGAEGAPEEAPFDRVVATCSVRRVPAAWFDQCAPGGLMVVPVKGALAGGAIAWLQKRADGTAVGRFLHTPAAFMPLLTGPQSAPTPPEIPETPEVPEAEVGSVRRVSELSGSVLDDWTFSFFAYLHLSASTVRSFRQGPDGTHVTVLFDPLDNSYARVTDHPSGPGATVLTSGCRDLWEPIEKAHAHWLGLHRPRREWFTLHAAPDRQTVAYTAPDGREWRWDL